MSGTSITLYFDVSFLSTWYIIGLGPKSEFNLNFGKNLDTDMNPEFVEGFSIIEIRVLLRL